ncbi:hypothetical protein RJ640_002161, partial [Escallonia rubra]
ANHFIKEEAQFLRVAMGHENESLDEFLEAHRTCLNDMMYFPTRNAYGLSSVAGNLEKLAALQNEFENVKTRMDDDTKKAQRLEQKIKLLTNGYQMRAGKLWSQIEATFKKMDTAGTELECFQALQKQEHLASSNRINGLWEEVQKQKDLEQNFQRRYGNLIAEQERLERLMNEHREKAKMQEELAEKQRALELAAAAAEAEAAAEAAGAASAELANKQLALELVDAEIAAVAELAEKQRALEFAEANAAAAENQAVVSNSEMPEPVVSSGELGNSIAVEPSPDEARSQHSALTELPEAEGAEDQTVVSTSEVPGPVAASDGLENSKAVDAGLDDTNQEQAGMDLHVITAEHHADTDPPVLRSEISEPVAYSDGQVNCTTVDSISDETTNQRRDASAEQDRASPKRGLDSHPVEESVTMEMDG